MLLLKLISQKLMDRFYIPNITRTLMQNLKVLLYFKMGQEHL